MNRNWHKPLRSVSGFLFLFFLISCGGEDNLEKILRDFSLTTDEAVNRINEEGGKANREVIASTLDSYTAKIEKLLARYRKLQSDVRQTGGELRIYSEPINGEFRQVADEFGDTIPQVGMYLHDAEIMNSFRRASRAITVFFK